MSPRSQFEEELNKLNRKLVKMASFIEEAISKSITALKTQDKELAKQIIKDDDIADAYEQNIEKYCINLIAREQPLAGDLRSISTALKIITDLERIADHCADISDLTLRLSDEEYVKPLVDIPKMAYIAKGMVTEAIDSFIEEDVLAAQRVIDEDDRVDEYFNKIIFELIPYIKNNPSDVDQCIDLMFITKYLERMADHATNIAEWTIFRVEGKHETTK